MEKIKINHGRKLVGNSRDGNSHRTNHLDAGNKIVVEISELLCCGLFIDFESNSKNRSEIQLLNNFVWSLKNMTHELKIIINT